MFAQAEHNITIMKKHITCLTILFLLLMVNSCKWFTATTPTPAAIPLPDTALCTKDATTMEENYIVHKAIDIENEVDHRVISFTNKQMKDNIEYLTAKAHKEGIEEDKLGFRVYIVAKAADEFDVPDLVKGDAKSILDKKEPYYTTVFFVATQKGDSDNPNDYENMYTVPALDYGSSRIPPPPIKYQSNKPCPIHPNVTH